jgi:uncharacterized membrane protein
MAANQLNLRPAARPQAAFLRMALTVLMTLVVILTPGLVPAQAAERPAEGYFNFVNQTTTTLWIAISYLDEDNCGPDGWVSRGWYSVDPGEISAVLRLRDNDSTHFYFYAYGEDGATFFDGATPTYVDRHQKFFWCEPVAGSRPDLDTVSMEDIVIDSQTTTYILRLGSDRYVSLEDESSDSVPFEPADQPEPDEDGCFISGGVRLCPAPD